MTGVRTVLLTAPDADSATRIVTALVEERLAACGNIVPGVTSIYRWQGAIEQATEVLITMKTTAARVEQLIERAAALHPYDVPEVLVLPVLAGHQPYLEWVASSTFRGVGE